MSDKIKNLLTCQICKNIFQNPIYLPCFCTICQHHLPDLMINEKVKCDLCQEINEIGSLGLKENIHYRNLIDEGEHLTNEEKVIKQNGKILEKLIEKHSDTASELETFYKAHLQKL